MKRAPELQLGGVTIPIRATSTGPPAAPAPAPSSIPRDYRRRASSGPPLNAPRDKVHIAMQLFLSHATADQDLVERVSTELASLDVRVYAAEHDNQAGTNLHEKVAEALAVSDLVVVVLTQAGFDSRYVHQEIGAALAAGKLVIPLVTSAVSHEGLGMLQGIEYIVLDPNEPASAMTSLAARIAALQQQACQQREAQILHEAEQRDQAARELMAITGLALIVVGLVLVARVE